MKTIPSILATFDSVGRLCHWEQPNRKLFSKRILIFCEKWSILEILAFDLPSASVFQVFNITILLALSVIEKRFCASCPFSQAEVALR